MVTIIIKKPHKPSVIKPSYHLKPNKVIAQACPLGFEQSFSITYPYENVVPKSNLIPMILAINPDYKNKTDLIDQDKAIIPI